MKKYIFLLLSAVVAFCGCEGAKSDASITLVQTSKDEINVSGDGAKVKVGFASALDWYVETPDEWITVTPDKGAAGTALITVQVDKNLETEERTGVVNICSDDLVFPVRVIQKPYEATFEIFEDHKYVSCLGGEVTISINTDIYICILQSLTNRHYQADSLSLYVRNYLIKNNQNLFSISHFHNQVLF